MSKRPVTLAPTRRRALWLVQGAVALFGLAGVLGKLIALPATVIVLGRVMFGALSLGVMLQARHRFVMPRSSRELGILVISGAVLALHWTTFFQSIQVSTVAIALLSYSSFPLFTTVLEPLLLHESPSRLELIGAVCVIPGVYLIVPAPSISNSTTQGVLWGLGSGATFALLSIWNRWLTRQYPSAVIGFYQESAATLILLPTLFILRPAALSIHDIVLLAILGVICTAISHTLFIEGLRTLSAQVASLIAALEPVWGIAFAAIVLRELPDGRTLVGGLCIMMATLIPWLRHPPNTSEASGEARSPV